MNCHDPLLRKRWILRKPLLRVMTTKKNHKRPNPLKRMWVKTRGNLLLRRGAQRDPRRMSSPISSANPFILMMMAVSIRQECWSRKFLTQSWTSSILMGTYVTPLSHFLSQKRIPSSRVSPSIELTFMNICRGISVTKKGLESTPIIMEVNIGGSTLTPFPSMISTT